MLGGFLVLIAVVWVFDTLLPGLGRSLGLAGWVLPLAVWSAICLALWTSNVWLKVPAPPRD